MSDAHAPAFRRAVVALNGATGEMKWMYGMDEGERATRWAPRQLSGRGLSYWTDGRGDERIGITVENREWRPNSGRQLNRRLRIVPNRGDP